MHDRSECGLDRLRRTRRDGDFVGGIIVSTVQRCNFLRNSFPQRKNARHRRILVVTRAHGIIHHVDETWITCEIRKALTKIDRANFLRERGHGRKDGGADVRKL